MEKTVDKLELQAQPEAALPINSTILGYSLRLYPRQVTGNHIKKDDLVAPTFKHGRRTTLWIKERVETGLYWLAPTRTPTSTRREANHFDISFHSSGRQSLLPDLSGHPKTGGVHLQTPLPVAGRLWRFYRQREDTTFGSSTTKLIDWQIAQRVTKSQCRATPPR